VSRPADAAGATSAAVENRLALRAFQQAMHTIILLAVALLPAVVLAAPAPLAPKPLTWTMDVDAAVGALERARMAPRREERRMYFRGAAGVEHTAEPEVFFVPRAGWTGAALFAWDSAATEYRLVSITLNGTLSADELARELAALERTHGPPTRRTGAQRLWQRAGVRLVASPSPAPDPESGKWTLHIVHLRNDEPAP
jgi:hypothetical protein